MKVVSLFFISLFMAIAGQAQNEAALLQRVKAKMDKIHDYQASATMKLDVSFIKAPPSAITVYYREPDMYKVVKRHGISILPKGGISVNMDALLHTEDYTIVPAGKAVVNGVPTTVVKLLPTADNSDVVLTTLYIDEKNAVVKKSSITTRENGSYEMELAYGKYMAYGLPDKVVFSFNAKDYQLPKGVTFEYEKGGADQPKGVKNKKGKVEITYTNYILNKGIDKKIFTDK